MAEMAILQEVDKCIRCNGCVIACKRTHRMKALNPGEHRIAADHRVMIKSQSAGDMGPFVRHSCWHCGTYPTQPPCSKRCPYDAITKTASGAVNVDFSKCDPATCRQQCVADCNKGGYYRVGVGSDAYSTAKAYKCTLCEGRAGASGDLPTKATAAEIFAVPDKAHQPACVMTCPAKAMSYDTRTNIVATLGTKRTAFYALTGRWPAIWGNGSMFWYSEEYMLEPKADPFIEDHIVPTVSRLVTSPIAKAAVVPTLVVGGLMAISARRVQNEQEEHATTLGEV